ncbi:hypothetical protein [Egicoccus sp. AB-alg2]|uniref:hypothetical protein n=1 Tax=Egicoccus sp. AB-alg2 TaxID=3242693 RepID=UPI00359DEE2C
MANGTSAAVDQAARLDEIGFPEFTTKLVTDVFDALVASNLRQTESFAELLGAVGKELSEYIDDTKDDIGGEEILQFLAAVAPPDTDDGSEPSKVRVGGTLDGDDADALNTALAVPGEEIPDVASSGAVDQAAFDAIVEAAARRLAANKYDLLSEMVRQGLLRLVVETGTIETRLTFTTYGSTFSARNSRDYTRRATAFRAQARTGSVLSKWVSASGSASRTSVAVRTTSEQDRDTSGSRVQIYGGVTINFKTDYLPLNQ